MRLIVWFFCPWFFYKLLLVAFAFLAILADILPILQLIAPELAHFIVYAWLTAIAWISEYTFELIVFGLFNLLFFPLMFAGSPSKRGPY